MQVKLVFWVVRGVDTCLPHENSPRNAIQKFFVFDLDFAGGRVTFFRNLILSRESKTNQNDVRKVFGYRVIRDVKLCLGVV